MVTQNRFGSIRNRFQLSPMKKQKAVKKKIIACICAQESRCKRQAFLISNEAPNGSVICWRCGLYHPKEKMENGKQ